MKYFSRNIFRRILPGMLIILSLFVISCTNTSTKSGQGKPVSEQETAGSSTPSARGSGGFSDAFPPSTPLVCPGDQNTTSQHTFVQRQENQLVYNGNPLKLYGFTFYPSLLGGSAAWSESNFTLYIDHIINLAKQAGQNLLRPTDFWNKSYNDNPSENTIIWQNMDYLVCAAKQQNMFVEMDVSAFGWFLLSQNQDEFKASNWQPFLEAVAHHYINQSAVAFYYILGEPTPPKTVAETNQLVDFYRSVTDDLRAVDRNHLIMAAGFNHMQDSPELDWWQQIYALPNNDLMGFKTYSLSDLSLIPAIVAYANQLGKPMFDQEFGMPQGQGDGIATGQIYNKLQMSRAQFFSRVYSLGAADGIIGFVFWNLGCQVADTSYEVSPLTPSVWNVVRQYAPIPPQAATTSQPTCP